jgi:hypothetical protein
MAMKRVPPPVSTTIIPHPLCWTLSHEKLNQKVPGLDHL